MKNSYRLFEVPLVMFLTYLMTPVAVAEQLHVVGGFYEIESQMVLPHMEEMRRILKNVNACIDDGDAAHLFPVFHQPALAGCVLVPSDVGVATAHYVLNCTGVNGATGTAKLKFTDHHIRGELNAKMGGKNMTFSQYVKARRDGRCPTQ